MMSWNWTHWATENGLVPHNVDTDDSFNFLIAILHAAVSICFAIKADDVYGGKLPVHVRCLLDEFANIGQIPAGKVGCDHPQREMSASMVCRRRAS